MVESGETNATGSVEVLQGALEQGGATDASDLESALRELVLVSPAQAVDFAYALYSRGIARDVAALVLARHEYAAGDLDAAARYAEMALKTHPRDPQMRALIATVRLQQGRPREAIEWAQGNSSDELPEDPLLLMVLGSSFVEAGRSIQGIPILRRAQALDPSLPGISQAVAAAYLRRWGPPVRILSLVCIAWAALDPGLLGGVMMVIAVAVFAASAAVALRARQYTSALTMLAFVALAVAGHFLFAPHAFA